MDNNEARTYILERFDDLIGDETASRIINSLAFTMGAEDFVDWARRNEYTRLEECEECERLFDPEEWETHCRDCRTCGCCDRVVADFDDLDSDGNCEDCQPEEEGFEPEWEVGDWVAYNIGERWVAAVVLAVDTSDPEYPYQLGYEDEPGKDYENVWAAPYEVRRESEAL